MRDVDSTLARVRKCPARVVDRLRSRASHATRPQPARVIIRTKTISRTSHTTAPPSPLTITIIHHPSTEAERTIEGYWIADLNTEKPQTPIIRLIPVMASAALPGDNISHHLTSPPRVRFDQANVEEEEEQTRLRRGSVSKDLRNQIALRGIIGRNAVSQGYATSRSFSRSQSEASIFRPDPRPELEPPVAEGALDNPSNTLWKSRYTQLNRVKSTSSVISGLNDDVLRAGWRRNEPGPLWEQSRELDYDRQAITNIPELDEGDGFDVEEMELDVDSSPAISNDLSSLMMQSDDANESTDQFGALPNFSHLTTALTAPDAQRRFSKTKSMPVGGTFGTRPEQDRFHREFDSTFMRMDVEF
ncbi:hypothetical protein H4Q26_011098 [Puccinia striiformis f. sp. tritici PST-130]|uniref:Uncharacterized protein n=2 Tax=Puccinia striiformis f. sp. tritici TaxID=168172 RepID=A0A0L0VWW2_9BASI|nr:hypothetical protein H4Q26_011098 [Puccinia striiformis f. sp. tritici PST-130]KNF03809.1 hypothetical protein PSTG_02903 [Puccinia striiformis f. sp. tritici PST-78]